MDGGSPDLGNKSPVNAAAKEVTQTPPIEGFKKRSAALAVVDSRRADLDNRFIVDVAKGNIFFVRQQYDPGDPRRDEVQHEGIVRRLVAEKIMDEPANARGGYLFVLDAEQGEVMYSNKAGSLTTNFGETSGSYDPGAAEAEFDAFFASIPEDDSEGPHFFVIDRDYGFKKEM